jgi:hypothetical protein
LSEIYYQLYKKNKNNGDLEKHKTFTDKAFNLKTLFDTNNSTLNTFVLNASNQKSQHIGKTILFSIGINEYEDLRIERLNYAENDSMSVVKFFKKAFPNNLEHIIINGNSATKESIIQELEAMRYVVHKEDSIVFYYSGHGVSTDILNIPDISSDLITTEFINDFIGDTSTRYLLSADSNLDDVSNTALQLKNIVNVLNSFGTSTPPLVIVDACSTVTDDYKTTQESFVLANIFGRKNDSVRIVDDREINKAIIIESSYYGQRSAETPDYNNGIFTHHFLSALYDDIEKTGNTPLNIVELANEAQFGINQYLKNKDFSQEITLIH